MADLRKHSSTSNLIRFVLKHATTGQGLTGLTSASSGLIISTICDNEATATVYTAAGSTIEGITTLGTFATPTATKCRFKEVDATNHPGLYEFQFANARFSVSNAKRLIITVSGAANLLTADYEIHLTGIDIGLGADYGAAVLAADITGGMVTNSLGELLQDNIDQTISSRASQTDVTTLLTRIPVAPFIASSVNDASATTTSFIGASGLPAVDDFFKDGVIAFTSGALQGVARRLPVGTYVGSTRRFTFAADKALPSAPANGVTFIILGRIE